MSPLLPSSGTPVVGGDVRGVGRDGVGVDRSAVAAGAGAAGVPGDAGVPVSDQRADALVIANATRAALAGVRRRMRVLSFIEGCGELAAMLDDPVDVGAVRLDRFLKCGPRIGEFNVQRLYRIAGVTQFDRRVRELTPRQRGVLAGELRRMALGRDGVSV